MRTRPTVLTSQQLLGPVAVAKKKLSQIHVLSPSQSSASLLREGLFALAVATVEYMLNNVLAMLLRQIPWKLPEKTFTVSRDSLVDPESDPLEDQIQLYLMRLGYKRLDEFLDAFCDRLSISLSAYRANHGNSLQELKESRNLLLHNDLLTNAIYLAKAGSKARAKQIDIKLEIDFPYFSSSLQVLEELCNACQVGILAKYGSYTKARAIRRLWDYVFQTPILKFDDYWEEDPIKDTVHLKTEKFRVGMSDSEQIFLGIWLTHYNQSGSSFLNELSMPRLDEVNRAKVLWLLRVLKEFRVY